MDERGVHWGDGSSQALSRLASVGDVLRSLAPGGGRLRPSDLSDNGDDFIDSLLSAGSRVLDSRVSLPARISFEGLHLPLGLSSTTTLAQAFEGLRYAGREGAELLLAVLVANYFRGSSDLPRSVFERAERVVNRFRTPAVTFLSCNVWGLSHLARSRLRLTTKPRRFIELGEEIARGGFDLVGLQEMWHPDTQQIFEASGLPHIVHDGTAGRLFRSSGLAILSRYPVIASSFTPFSKRPGVERYVRKGVLFARVLHPTLGTVDVFNVHLASDPERLNRALVTPGRVREVRRYQLREIEAVISHYRGIDSTTVLLGDFNIPEHEEEHRNLLVLAGIDIFREYRAFESRELGATFDPRSNDMAQNATGEPERIDYIFMVTPSARRWAYRASRVFVEQPLSDHYGVEASIVPL